MLNLIVLTSIISNAQSNTPTLLVNSAESQPISYNQIKNNAVGYPSYITGNIFYMLNINSTIVFPQASKFTGLFLYPCGVAVALVNTPEWQIINFIYNCPAIFSNSPISAGVYNFTANVYINSVKNYSNSNYPKTIEFYVYTNMNTPKYVSNNYSLNLSDSLTSYNPSSISITPKSNNTLQFSGMPILFIGLVVFVVFRGKKNYRK